MRISAGDVVVHLDDDPNGNTVYRRAVVVRARGDGVLVERRIGAEAARYRITRGDVSRVVPTTGGACARCGRRTEVVSVAPAGESGNVTRCPICDDTDQGD